ncbi:hypothetical protein VTI28DRAFT_763 [Corynascus sepedonium]
MLNPSDRDTRNRNRIRDNQRRSRARRKEYLEELEQRLQLAEQRGLQASLELQAAARRVADENRKLRALLRLHGASDRAIDAHLATGEDDANAAQRLERLLLPSLPPETRSAQSTVAFRKSSPSRPTSTSLNPEPVNDDDGENNCSMAADLISTMTGANPHEVRTSLGCVPGADCHVDNAKIGTAIERLTESGIVT